jgi:hypothetical protein
MTYKIINKSIQVLGAEIGSITYYLLPSMQHLVYLIHNQENLLNKPVVLLGHFNCRYPGISPNQAHRNGWIPQATQLLNDDTLTRIPHPIARSYAVDLTFTSIDIATATQWAITI